MIITLVRYAAVFLAVALGVAFAVQFANTNWESTLGSAIQVVVPAMIASVVEGAQFAKAEKRKPLGTEAWNFAFVGMIMATVLMVALAYLAGDLAPEFSKLATAPVGSQAFLIWVALYAGAYLICNRLFMGIGAGNQISVMRSKGLIE
jgi:hypothetical protein